MKDIKNKVFWIFFLTNCLYTSVLFPIVFIVSFVFSVIFGLIIFAVVSVANSYLNLLAQGFSSPSFDTLVFLATIQSLIFFLLVNLVLSLILIRHYKVEINSGGVKIIKGLRDVKERLYSKDNIAEVKITRNFAGLLLGTYDILITPKYGKKSQLALYNPGRVIGLKKEKAEELYRTLLVYAIQNGGDAN